MVAATLLVANAQQETRTPPGARQVLQPTAAPAVDAGLADESQVRLSHKVAVERDRDARTLPYQPGKVIVRFRGGVSGTRSAAARAVGATEVYTPSYADFDIMRIDESADPEAVAAALMQRDDVEYTQAAYRVYPYYKPNDPLYTNQWNFPAIGMEEAWDINPGSSSTITVAVLDTGVAYTNAIYEFTGTSVHAERRALPGPGARPGAFRRSPLNSGARRRFVSPRDFIWDDNEPVDMDGHGTHVSGTIGQVTNNAVGVAGMAFNVRIMPVKCIASVWDDAFDSPFVGTDDIVARAIRYAADNGAKVINMSLGRNGGASRAADRGRDPVRGGQGRLRCRGRGQRLRGWQSGRAGGRAGGPHRGGDGRGAVGRSLSRAYYSGVKPYVEIAAPGGDFRAAGSSSSGLILQQTYSSATTNTYLLGPTRYTAPRFDVFVYAYYQGTSMATPHVAGFAAMLMSQGITNPVAVEAAIKRFATDKGAPGRDDEYGEGLINPRNSLRGLGIIK